MSEEDNRNYCVQYLVQRGIAESEAENLSQIALCAYHLDPKQESLQQTCEFMMQVLNHISMDSVSQV